MNQTQKNYLLKRIDAEALDKEAAINAKHSIPSWGAVDKRKAIVEHKLAIAFSLEEIYEKIRKGDYWGFDILYLFDTDSVKPDIEAAKKARREALGILHDRVNHLKDTVMLGDEETALTMLNDFIKEEF